MTTAQALPYIAVWPGDLSHPGLPSSLCAPRFAPFLLSFLYTSLAVNCRHDFPAILTLTGNLYSPAAWRHRPHGLAG